MLKIMIDSDKLKISDKYVFQKSDLNKAINDTISELLPKKRDSSINMEDIQKAIVPIVKDIDIFFSYSHDDEKQVKRLATYFINLGYKVFLDCLFWKNIDDSLDEYNKNYCVNSNGNYDYKKIKLSSTTFDMILSDSIIETVKNSKVFVFVKSNNSVHDLRTVSPWIYLENKVAQNMPSTNINKFLFEDSKNTPPITFKLDSYGYYIAKDANDINEMIKRIIK